MMHRSSNRVAPSSMLGEEGQQQQQQQQQRPTSGFASAATRCAVAAALIVLLVVPLFLLPTVAVMLVTSEIDVHPIVEHLMAAEQCASCRTVVDKAVSALHNDVRLQGRYCGAPSSSSDSSAPEALVARAACSLRSGTAAAGKTDQTTSEIDDDDGTAGLLRLNCTAFIVAQRAPICEQSALVSAARQHVLGRHERMAVAAAAASSQMLSCPLIPLFFRPPAVDPTAAATAVPPLACMVQQHLFLSMGTGPVCSGVCEGSLRLVDWLLVQLLRVLARSPSLQLLCFSVREVLGGVMLLGAQGGLLVLLLQIKRVHWELQRNVVAARRLLRRAPPAAAVAPVGGNGGGGSRPSTSLTASTRGNVKSSGAR